MKTTIFLDVDGVINSMSNKPPVKMTGWDTWERVRAEGFGILFAVELVDALNDLASRDDVEIVWLTTWCDLAATSLSPKIGLNGTNWRVCDLEPGEAKYSDGDRSWWKYRAIRKWWDSENRADQKFIWIDDDLNWEDSHKEWVSMIGFESAMLICPQSLLGITSNHIKSIHNFIA